MADVLVEWRDSSDLSLYTLRAFATSEWNALQKQMTSNPNTKLYLLGISDKQVSMSQILADTLVHKRDIAITFIKLRNAIGGLKNRVIGTYDVFSLVEDEYRNVLASGDGDWIVNPKTGYPIKEGGQAYQKFLNDPSWADAIRGAQRYRSKEEASLAGIIVREVF